MNKIFFFIIFVLCSLFTFSQNIEGKWLFESIRFENDTTGQDLKPIADGDFMLINEDGTFEYALSAVPLKANGNWTLNKSALSFNYTEPKGTIRNYSTTLTKTHLILSENGVNYSFQREVVAPISAPILQMVPLPVQDNDLAPSPKYSMIFPVPPFTVRIPANFKMTSFEEAHPSSFSVR